MRAVPATPGLWAGIYRWLFWLVLLLCWSGCSGAEQSSMPVPASTLMPTPVVLPTAGAPAASPTTAPADTGWLSAGAGIALRRFRFAHPAGPAQVSVLRVDPRLHRFRVAYAPDAPRSLNAWQESSNALALINGGFFDEANRTTALLISNGTVSGESYVGRGGMFAVDQAGAVWLRYLGEQAYDPAESLVEALQGWPMLVRSGGVQAYTFEDGIRARRSAIAIDREGHVLLIASPTASFTLRELAEWLIGADLGIDAALNLDGGSSTGLLLATDSLHERIDAFVPLPTVLLVLAGEQ